MIADDELALSKTRLVLRLAKEMNIGFVSRSEARRMAARLDQFAEVWVDFDGVDEIGPSFADEMFCVFPYRHPRTKLTPVSANDQILRWVKTATNRLAALRANPPGQA